MVGDVFVFSTSKEALQRMDSHSEGSSEDGSMTSWVEWFQTLKGNELFCTVDQEFLLDRFNLTGLNTEVRHFTLAYDIITDSLGFDHANRTVRSSIQICGTRQKRALDTFTD